MLMDSSWTDLLYRGIRSYPSPGPAVVFFVVTYCVFMYGLFIFFIAILLVRSGTPFTPHHVHPHPAPCSLEKKKIGFGYRFDLCFFLCIAR
jgi:hypothetical protein